MNTPTVEQGEPISTVRFYRLLISFLPLGMVYLLFLIALRFSPWVKWNTSLGLEASPAYQAIFVPIILITISIGFLIIRRKPGNVCGPLIIYFGIGLTNPNSLQVTSGYVLALVQFTNQTFFLLLPAFLFVYFPDGKPAFRTGWHIIRILIIPLLAVALLWILAAPDIDDAMIIPNPIFVPALHSLLPLATIGFPLILYIIWPLAIASVFIHYRHSGMHERRQIRWFLFVSSYMLGLMVAWIVIYSVPSWFDGWPGTLLKFASIGYYLIPAIGVGLPILRHRLYDIDIIIRRTLIYATLTTILAVVYFGTVVLVQQVFRAFTGQTTDLTIVISTLVIAALFNPLRHRIQAVIDRRLYRRKYDVEKTLETFNRSLRDEADLETLKQSLVGVVQETMQPTHVALWVQKPYSNIGKEDR